jgi:hypothetical protein
MGLILTLLPAAPLTINPDSVTSIPGSASAIAVGADGSLYIVGTSPGDINGFPPFKWNGSSFSSFAGSGVRIAVDPNGTLWLLNKNGGLYHYHGPNDQSSDQVSTAASDVAVGADGSVYIVGNANSDNNGFVPSKWNGSSFQPIAGRGVRIAVDPNGTLWLVNKNGGIYHYVSASSQNSTQIPGAATAISASADGDVYIVGTDSCDNTGCQIYRFNGNSFTAITGLKGMEIAADRGGMLWVVTSQNLVIHFGPTPAIGTTISSWVSSNQLPSTSRMLLAGGNEAQGYQEYVCRGADGNYTYPGRYVPQFGKCFIAFSGTEVGLSTFEVLTDFSGIWVPASAGAIPNSAVSVSISNVAFFQHSCRGFLGGGMEVGRVIEGDPGCSVSLNGAVTILPSYFLARKSLALASRKATARSGVTRKSETPTGVSGGR